MQKPSDTELCLLRALWASNPLSGREIHDATQAETGWSYSSTRKTLDRMVEKGLISIELAHGLKTFIPAQSKLRTLAGLIRDFSRNILDADTPLPAAAFVGSKLIDQEEISELEQLLAEFDQSTEGKK